MTKVLTTGASGFVGGYLARQLDAEGFSVISPVRRATCLGSLTIEMPVVCSLDGKTDWGTVLQNVDVVVHCAARAHIMKDECIAPLRSTAGLTLKVP